MTIWVGSFQVVEMGQKYVGLDNIEYFAEKKASVGCFALVLLKGFACDEVHDQVPMSKGLKVLIDAWQIGMIQLR